MEYASRNWYEQFKARNKLSGAVILVVFLVLAAFAYWIGTAPRPFISNPGSALGPIVLENIEEGITIPQIFTIKGHANNLWFFEGTMAAGVYSSDGRILWEGVAIAENDYEQEGFVDFSSSIDVGDYVGLAVIVFTPDYESSNPNLHGAYRIRVNIAK